MAGRVDIDIYANDMTEGTLGGIGSKLDSIEAGFTSITGISLTTAGVVAAVGSAVSGIVDYTKDAIVEVTTYNDQVGGLARITGSSLEETSRLIQVAQDMGVEYKDLVQGLGTATKNGVDVSIESILDLADEYAALETPIDRAKFLTENFGSAGQDLAPIFEAASADIVQAMEDVDESMVWDEEKQAAVDAYETGIGEVKKSFEELKMEVGMNVLPTIQSLLNVINDEEGWRSEGYKRMIGDVTKESWAAVDAVKALITWLATIAAGPYGGKWFDAESLGIGGPGFALPNPYGIPDPGTGLPPGWGTVPGEGDAWGGRQSPNTAYLVGERGPELFVPGTGGKIIPNHQLGGMGKGGGAEIDYTRLARVLSQELQKGNFR